MADLSCYRNEVLLFVGWGGTIVSGNDNEEEVFFINVHLQYGNSAIAETKFVKKL